MGANERRQTMTDDTAPVRYIERTRAYYRALGYAKDYVWSSHADVPFAPLGKAGSFAYEQAHRHGLIVRGIQDTVAFCPPLIITPAEVRDMVDRFARTLDDVARYVAA